MADERTFVLVSEFRDGVTPGLEKINNTINNLKQSLNVFGSKKGGFNDLTKSMGKVINAHMKLKEEIAGVRNELKNTLPVLREYRREVGKAVSANMHLGGQRFVRKNNPHLQFLEAATQQTRELAQASRGVVLGRRMPRGGGGGTPAAGGGGGGGTRPPRTPGYPTGGGGGYVPPSRPTSTFGTKKFGVSRDETFAFGQTLGYTLGSTMTGAIVQGFQIGVGFLTLPFQHLAGAMQERIADESTDIQTAGAMFAISERKNMNMFSNFNQAIRAQQEINKKLAESAAALPGATTEYVQMGKRVLDSMMTVLSKDVAGVSKFAGELGAENAQDPENVLATLTQKFTEKAVLLGQGSQYRGAYGVPQLLEMLIGSENISENMFNKFAQFRELPIFQSVFRDLEGEISKTGAFSAERIRMVFRLLDEALPNEVIQAHKNTMAGFLEATRSAFLDPEVGLFGLGRKVQNLQVAMVDQYGNFVNKQGNIVNSWDEAAKEQISVYESIQKILTGFGLPLSELAAILPQLYEPFAQIIAPLQSLFKVAQGFYRNFNIYTKEFENLAKSFADQGLTEAAAKMKKTAGARGTLLAISNLLTTFGDMSGGKFKEISTKLQDPAADITAVAKEVMDTLFSSSFMEDLGYQIGLIVGGVVNTLAQFLGFATGTLGDAGIVKGIKAGFDAAEGLKAVQFIIQNIFKLLFRAIIEVFKLAPLEISIIGSVALLIPAFVSSVSIMLANWLEEVLEGTSKGFGKKLQAYKDLGSILTRPSLAMGGLGAGIKSNAKPTGISNVKFRPVGMPPKGFEHIALPGKGAPVVSGVTSPGKAPSIPKAAALKKTPFGALSALKAKGVGAMAAAMVTLSSKAPGLTKAAKAMTFISQKVLGFGAGGLEGLKNPVKMLGKFGTAVTGITGILSGVKRFFETGDIWKSIGAAAGPIAGTIIGTAIAGPLGGFIAGWIMSNTSFTDKLGEIMSQLADSVMYITGTLGAMGKDFLIFVQALTGATTETQALNQSLAALNVILFPLTATMDALAVASALFRIAMLEIYMLVDGFTGNKKQKELAAQYEEANKSLARLIAANDEKYARISRSKGATSVLGGKPVTWDGRQWVGADGKPAGATPTPTPKPAAPPKPIGGLPAGGPGAIPSQAAVPEEVKQTATNIQQINTKAAQQVTQGAAVQKSTDETKKNTATANTTLGNIKVGMMAVSNKLTSLQNAMLGDLNNIQAGVASISSLLSSGSLQVKSSFGPMPMGGAPGNLGGAQALASQFGLQLTSWVRPGDPGMHGAGRAMDFSNGVNTPQQMAFAQAMISQYGSSLAELIYTPLGFGIKNGMPVPLSFWGEKTNAMHYNHVHVAFANGLQDGKMFTNQSAAGGWEGSMVPGSVKVASITGNSAESFGGSNFGDINVTVNAGAVNDADELASIVALKIGEAVADARAASIFV